MCGWLHNQCLLGLRKKKEDAHLDRRLYTKVTV